jgi:hypothetical protein
VRQLACIPQAVRRNLLASNARSRALFVRSRSASLVHGFQQGEEGFDTNQGSSPYLHRLNVPPRNETVKSRPPKPAEKASFRNRTANPLSKRNRANERDLPPRLEGKLSTLRLGLTGHRRSRPVLATPVPFSCASPSVLQDTRSDLGNFTRVSESKQVKKWRKNDPSASLYEQRRTPMDLCE